MSVNRFACAVVVLGLCAAVPAGAPASKPGTIAPSRQQRIAILKAFGEPKAGWRCTKVRLASSNHSYATVRFLGLKGCGRWAFNGLDVIKRRRDNRWAVLFEGSAFACPLARIPRQVQRDLGVCP
jgi:hypothetical protein